MKLNKGPVKRKRVSDFGSPAPQGLGFSEVMEVVVVIAGIAALIYFLG